MTKEELEQCGCWFTDTGECVKDDIDLNKFAKLVIEHEREKYTKLYEEEIRSIREAATQYGIPSEDVAGMLLFSEEYANMIAEREREACAKMCDYVYENIVTDEHIKDMAFKIRARGQE